jgi:aryl-alcohol dehydrogenase-like predicted oxidoreductase
MKYRTHQGLTLSEIGVGCYALSGVYGSKDVQEFERMLRRAFELGVNFFDTADAYGDAEQILGRAVRPFRQEIHIATKVGVQDGLDFNLSGDYVRGACEQSLQKLQTDYVDLYQVHFDDPGTPVAETVGALEELVSAGKIRRYGVGHLPADKVQTYLSTGHVFSLLLELSAVARASRQTLLPLCQAHDTGAIAFSVTGRGILSGKFTAQTKFEPDDIRNVDPLFQRERFQSALSVAARFGELAQQHGKTPAQAAIAWALAQPGVVCALTGPSTIPHLEENLGGSGWQLPASDLDELEQFFVQQDELLAQQSLASVQRILSEPSLADPVQVFTDLVYAVETAVLMGLTTEQDIMPTFMTLYEMRKSLDENTRPRLDEIRRQLNEIVKPFQEEK